MEGETRSTQTVESRNSVVDNALRPDSELHILVGGPYSDGKEEHRYGHTAIRIKTPESDTTYDFGRYGALIGTFGEEGEGILRVWSSFATYIAGENATGRTTTGFVFMIFRHQADAVNAHYATLTASARHRTDLERGRKTLQVYQLPSNYHALQYNCTTLSLDGARVAFPNFEQNSASHIDSTQVLNWKERAAMATIGGGEPNRLYLPANLQHFLSSSPPVPPIRTDTYGGGK